MGHLCMAGELVKNGDFQSNKMTGWTRMSGSTGALQTHNQGGFITAHLHGNCPSTQGGMQQTLSTKAGQEYTITFKGFNGHWDSANDNDRVDVKFGSVSKSFQVPAQYQWKAKKGQLLKFVAKATSTSTVLSFWSPKGDCMDVDDVSVRNKGVS